MANEHRLEPVRRIVTGHDANGVAKVVLDGPAPNVRSAGPGHAATQVWCTDVTPCDISIGPVEDMGLRKLGTAPPPNGSRLTVNDIPPGNKAIMHRTETLDYAIVLSGELDMDLDDSTVKVRAGDVVIQRGTHHAWVNRSNAPARVAFIMIDARPLGIGKPVTGMATVTGIKADE
jgi:quercetin dioxygenase-like cupin family protein